ncbi:MAG: hypothetical protein EOP04_21370 [Proteobacteria bacterium]|nr:MAG: hypothetical protein EOP04_21370 [Pseudomonadota bacterium]
MRFTKFRRITLAIVYLLSALSLGGCVMDSTISFNRGDALNAKVAKAATVSAHQGGTVGGETASRYKANVSLGTSTNRVQAVTGSGYKVQMNFPGKTSQ